MSDFITRMKEIAAEKARIAEDIIKNPFVDASVAADRMAICEACPSLNKPLNQCDICKCFMNLKTKINGMKCPDKKW